MALTENQRVQVWAAIMEAGLNPPDVLKGDFRSAVDALDDALDTYAASLNAALPLPYRTSAVAWQKAVLTGLIAIRRGLADAPEPAKVRRALGRLF